MALLYSLLTYSVSFLIFALHIGPTIILRCFNNNYNIIKINVMTIKSSIYCLQDTQGFFHRFEVEALRFAAFCPQDGVWLSSWNCGSMTYRNIRLARTFGLRTPNDLGPACPTIVNTAALVRARGLLGAPHFPLDCFCARINEGDVWRHSGG